MRKPGAAVVDLALLDVIEDAGLAWWTPEEDDEDGLYEVVLFGDELDTFTELVRTHGLTVRSESRLTCLLEGLGDQLLVHWQPPRRQRSLAVAIVVLDCETRSGQAFSGSDPEPIEPLTHWASGLVGHFDAEDPQYLGRVALIEALEAAGDFGASLSANDPVVDVLSVLIDDLWSRSGIASADWETLLAALCTDPDILKRARLLARDTPVKVKTSRAHRSERGRI